MEKRKISTVGDLVNLLSTFDQTTPLKIRYNPFQNYIDFPNNCIIPDRVNDAIVVDITTMVAGEIHHKQ